MSRHIDELQKKINSGEIVVVTNTRYAKNSYSLNDLEKLGYVEERYKVIYQTVVEEWWEVIADVQFDLVSRVYNPRTKETSTSIRRMKKGDTTERITADYS